MNAQISATAMPPAIKAGWRSSKRGPCIGQAVVVVGCANSAGQAALFLAQQVNQLHDLMRRDNLSETMSSYLSQRLTHHDRIAILARDARTRGSSTGHHDHGRFR